MKHVGCTFGAKARVAVVSTVAAAALLAAAPVALAASSPVLGFGDNTVVVKEALAVDGRFSEDEGKPADTSALAKPATRTEIVVKEEEPEPVAAEEASSEGGSSAQSSSAASADGAWHSGLASHYGIDDGFMGGICADGSIVTEDSMGVAMLNVPLGSQVEICYNGKSVVATVVDRGPYHGNRVIDLQPAVARALGTVEAGVVTVQYRIL